MRLDFQTMLFAHVLFWYQGYACCIQSNTLNPLYKQYSALPYLMQCGKSGQHIAICNLNQLVWPALASRGNRKGILLTWLMIFKKHIPISYVEMATKRWILNPEENPLSRGITKCNVKSPSSNSCGWDWLRRQDSTHRRAEVKDHKATQRLAEEQFC